MCLFKILSCTVDFMIILDQVHDNIQFSTYDTCLLKHPEHGYENFMLLSDDISLREGNSLYYWVTEKEWIVSKKVFCKGLHDKYQDDLKHSIQIDETTYLFKFYWKN